MTHNQAHDKTKSADSSPAAEILCQSNGDIWRQGEPVTCGVPWPRGAVHDISRLGMTDATGGPVALQARPLDLWPDGSVRWALLTWLASTDAAGAAAYRVEACRGVCAIGAQSQRRVSVVQEGAGLAVDTGSAVFRIVPGGAFPFASVEVGGRAVIDPRQSGLTILEESGRQWSMEVQIVEAQEQGPVRGCVRIEGRLRGPGGRQPCRCIGRLYFFAGLSTVQFELTLHNPRKAGHPGGCWDLGGAGSVMIRDASMRFQLAASQDTAAIRFSCEPGQSPEQAQGGLEIYQDSSGGENWQSPNHVVQNHVNPCSFRGYRVRDGRGERRGLRATPVVCLRNDASFLGAAMRRFWQNFPKAMEADCQGITLRLFPRQFSQSHELQGGEQKTHVFHVAFGPDVVTNEPMEWCRRPLIVHATPEWCCASQAVAHLASKSQAGDPAYDKLIDAALAGPGSLYCKREAVDEYGWRNFGDIYADHEAVFATGPQPLVSHYNNQYDAVLGCGLQFLRTGDARWLEIMDDLATHVTDVDIYHTDEDGSVLNHGMFWHTCHYMDADTSTHRSYPARYSHGGGPGSGHLYTSGLVLHYFLTGNPQSRDAVLELGRYVIDADDGAKSVFRWLDRGPTGKVSESAAGYYGPGRAPANTINALMDAHHLSGQLEFLCKAEELIRRSVHPGDDFQRLNLLDVERRWFYTMFLQSLGKYLDHKAQRGLLDWMYAYAKASLLHYARWMAQHECPYLDRPEILEYPTETWPAQDMRKSEVFCFAAKQTAGEERACFLKRAEFFFRSSVDTLLKMPTRTLARPVVVLLTNGLMHLYFQKHPDESAPASQEVAECGEPKVFVPQKARAIRRFKILVVAGGLAAAASAALLIHLLK
jgi:hypothetical protein